ncbi:hypothetical protein Rsub_09216 [Raphidocelis subcapitata]|uniref:Thiaminase-2/PQQC domain-containing protein n=1 Tax=Raphidocelis subcapitata TaxID=307507 RepID=A0A2V0PGT7_9CHLO|nr:hypothetical protein Rsub_09216 [Raphidocelis subcapitata]|eukprot:GBF96417.1 hypothetical protein Rsub_09216 [Raphidocelis subcapitata]
MAAPATTTAAMRAALEAEWRTATREHAFLRDVNAGAISAARFNTWLAQDYLYARCFSRLLGAMIAGCPEAHLATYVGGMAAIDVELKWFQAKAQERGIDLAATEMQPACKEYTAFLSSLHAQPYSVQAAAFWAMEAVYNQAWSRVGEGLADERYREFVERWGNAGFDAYCVALAAHADEALAAAGPEERGAADGAVRRVVKLELGFWEMAYHGSA